MALSDWVMVATDVVLPAKAPPIFIPMVVAILDHPKFSILVIVHVRVSEIDVLNCGLLGDPLFSRIFRCWLMCCALA